LKAHRVQRLNEKGEPIAEEQLVKTALLSKQLRSDIAIMETCTNKSRKTIELIETEMNILSDTFDATENEISQKYDHVLAVVELQRSRLRTDFGSCRKTILKELEESIAKEETLFLEMESFKSYCIDIDKSQLACCTSADGLHTRALAFVEAQDAAKSLEPKRLPTFVTSEFPAGIVGNLIGRFFAGGNAFSLKLLFLGFILSARE